MSSDLLVGTTVWMALHVSASYIQVCCHANSGFDRCMFLWFYLQLKCLLDLAIANAVFMPVGEKGSNSQSVQIPRLWMGCCICFKLCNNFSPCKGRSHLSCSFKFNFCKELRRESLWTVFQVNKHFSLWKSPWSGWFSWTELYLANLETYDVLSRLIILRIYLGWLRIDYLLPSRKLLV